MGERTSEVGTIDIMTLLLRDIDLLTARTVDLDSGSANFLAHTDRKCRLPVTQYPGTYPESPFCVLLTHDGQPFGRQDEASVNESIDISGLLVDAEVSDL